MTHTEINRKLALAIGWPTESMWIDGNDVHLLDRSNRPYGLFWRVFDHKNWRVIGPIAQRYNCFPHLTSGMWCAYFGDGRPAAFAHAPQKAIALAVIAAHEAGVLK